ncbi:MAG: AAA family ATPase [Thiolinea sp.]
MKILAIRGKNLASLARQFEVDFTAEPLASTGIFAIIGPTGAGKSTLLDALCLALYDDMPRLPREGYRGQNLPDVSGETIAPRDPRNILRRGAAEAFAEVDFVGNDGLAYRAHWSVRRARIKSEGRLQNSEMSLLCLANQQPLGSARKTEVLVAIAERIGLSFEQFTRAVLLAQNEFSAFLKASDDKRAELLQTLTGTDLFADLSRRAYQRAKSAEQSLNNLRERLAALNVLSTEQRQQQELASSQAQLQVQSLELERSQLELQWQWYQQAAQFQQACMAAEVLLTNAQANEQAATARQQFLSKLEAIQPARTIVENVERIKQALLKTQADQQAAHTHYSLAVTKQQLTQQQLNTAKQQLEQQQAAYQNLQPMLLQARKLDTIIQTLVPRCEAAVAEQTIAQQVLVNLQNRQTEQAKRLEQLADKSSQISDWLLANQQWRSLAEHWPHWHRLLQQAKASLTNQQNSALELKTGQAKLAQIQTAVEQAQLAMNAEQQDLAQAEALYKTSKTQAAAFDLDVLAQQHQNLEQQRAQLQTAEQTWQSLLATQQAAAKLQADIHQLAVEQDCCQQALEQLNIQRPSLERDCERAEHAWRLAEAACADQAAVWRAQLKAGDACPVCGATEHPYAQHNPALDAVLESLHQDYLQQRQALKVLETQFATEQAHELQYQQQSSHLEQSLAEAKRANAQAETNWQAYANLVTEQAIELSLKQQLATKQQALLTVKQQAQTARQSFQQLELTQSAFHQAQQANLTAQEQLNDLIAQQRQLQTQQQYLQQSQVDFTNQLNYGLQQLNVGFVDTVWQAAWLNSPEHFAQHCSTQVTAWQSQQQTAESLAQQTTELTTQQTQLNFELQQAQQAWERFQQQTAQLNSELQSQQTQRASLLAGQAVAAFEADWQAKLEQLTLAFKQAQSSLEQANQEQIRAVEAVAQLQALSTQYAKQQSQAQQDLAACLMSFKQAGFELDEFELGSLLSYEPAWLQQERAALQALQTATSNAQAVLAERQAQLVQHESLRLNAQSLEQVQTAHADNLLALQAAQQAWQELLLVLRNDLQSREQAKDLQADLDSLSSQARVWGQLNELIGSADGKKFRNFAQQYSLDVLLSYANRHLAELSRRYTLRRVRESLALLVLDQDMGGEIRSVHSLSGGESFLVSLALALGLASLSSQRVKVESLFIDEGFGSLDTDSLRVAMDALDQLQAQGRKVGVISHVQEMTERIAVQIQIRRLSGGQSYIKVA